MKLTDSEAVFLLQSLFLLKNSSIVSDWKTLEKVDSLYNKFLDYVNDENQEKIEDNSFILQHQPFDGHESGCSWHEEDYIDDHSNHDDDEEGDFESEILICDLLNLQQIVATDENNEKKSLRFVDGYNGMVDLDIENGDKIVCDVTRILRSETSLHLYTVEGWIDLGLHSFPKDWEALLSVDVIYKPRV
jgi:hypothetical protein